MLSNCVWYDARTGLITLLTSCCVRFSLTCLRLDCSTSDEEDLTGSSIRESSNVWATASVNACSEELRFIEGDDGSFGEDEGGC